MLQSAGSGDAGRAARPLVLLAGGGSGGHIYPNLAVAQRLAELMPGRPPRCVYLVSPRSIDRRVLASAGVEPDDVLALPAEPLSPANPIKFLRGYLDAKRRTRELVTAFRRAMPEARIVMAGTGGFVSGPAMAAAKALSVPAALVNLDAVPGKANRWSARFPEVIFTTRACADWPGAQVIGLPLRSELTDPLPPTTAREQLGLDPDRPTLLVFAGSQGGRSVNEAMAATVRGLDQAVAQLGWQVLHVAGPGAQDLPDSDAGGLQGLASAYESAGLPARVLPYCDRMACAWAAANLAVCRGGAGTIAEAWATATPCIVLPYPHHRDRHQARNAEPLVNAGGAVLLTDHAEASTTADELRPTLSALMSAPGRLVAMRDALKRGRPRDGAITVARWLAEHLREPVPPGA